MGGRGRGQWFAVPGGVAWSGGAGDRSTLAQATAGRAPEPWMIRWDAARAAEVAAREVLLRVHPTQEAERRRQDVVGYLKRLIGSTFGFEVFAFGSVPLKTYLPDGDIDITVLSNTWLNSSLIDDVRYVLNSEMDSPDAEFEVKGLHFIDADVKLLKCVVENIVVDISFNQIGGVSTLCFLELIDRQVGKDHLFKRSIMLIKAWCYHESRILGAHHRLLSTYALETLVLYIFNLFHKSLHGPVEVMYRFLEYYSKFDWDKYGISLFGPVHLSSLPDLTIEPTVAQDELLLGYEFLQGSLDKVVVNNGSSSHDTNFRLKFLNIIDPLKGNNNLGRSVCRASFYRIRSAFSLGAQKLGQILMLPSELIPGEICEFFSNTLNIHGNGERPDLGYYSSFESFLGPEIAPSGHVSSLKMSCITEGENRSSFDSSKLADKESKGPQMHKNSSTHLHGDVQGRPWNKFWFVEYASDFVANSSYLTSFSSHSSSSHQNGKGNRKMYSNGCGTYDLHHGRLPMPQQICANHQLLPISADSTDTLDDSSSYSVNTSDWTALHAEKKSPPPFSLSDMLNISGDLDLHLGCLRKVHYHLEYLFDELLKAIKEACLAGALDWGFFKRPTVSLETRPQRATIVSPTGTEARKLSPVCCFRSTKDVSQHSHVEDQAGVVWQQNLPLSRGGFTYSSSPVSNSDRYHVSWLSDAPKSRGTGTYIPRVNYDMYKEGKAAGRGFMRRQKPRLADRRYNTLDQWCSDERNEQTTFQSATNQLSAKQEGSLQDSDSSKSDDPNVSFPPLSKQTATGCGTKQTATNLPKANKINPDIPSSPSTDDSSKVSIQKERQIKPQSRGTTLPHCGEGNPPASYTCQSSPAAASYCLLKEQVAANIEFGSMGPFSLGLLSPSSFKYETSTGPCPNGGEP